VFLPVLILHSRVNGRYLIAGENQMLHKRFGLSDDHLIDLETDSKFLIAMEWAEFTLLKRIVNCLLTLLFLTTIFALAMVVLIVARRVDSSITVGAVLTGTIACIGKLLNNAFKSIFRLRA
jgi:hypothetical protein